MRLTKVVIFLAVLLVGVPLSAAQLIVDSVNGPYYSPEQAAAVATAGDTIFVKNGKYFTQFTLPPGVALIGEDQYGVILVSDAVNRGATLMKGSGGNFVSNVTFQFEGDNAPVIFNAWSYPSTNRTVIRDCSFLDGNTAIVLENNSGDVLIERCRFKDILEAPVLYRWTGSNLTIRDSIFDNCLSGVVLQARVTGALEIVNNTFANVTYVTFFVYDVSAAMVFVNNIVYGSSDGVNFRGGSLYADYNNYFAGGTNTSGFLPGPNSVTWDPMLIDPMNGDLRLDPNSPDIGYGDPAYPYTTPTGSGTINLVGAGFIMDDATLGILPPGPVPDPLVTALETLSQDLDAIVNGLPKRYEQLVVGFRLSRIDRWISRAKTGTLSESRLTKEVDDMIKDYGKLLSRIEKDQRRKRPRIPAADAADMMGAISGIISELNSFRSSIPPLFS